MKDVSISPIEDCYCIPSFTLDCILGDMIDDFVLIGEDDTSIENMATGCSEDGYDDRTDESVYLYQGEEYTATVTTQADQGDNVAIWIDFNDDGVFDESEMVGAGYLDVSTDVSISIPEDAGIGDHRMRVMVAFDADPNNPEEFDPCNLAEADFGETHDYTVEIGEMSVENHDFENFTYYPNPVESQLTLKAGEQIENATVYNLLGQKVLNVNPNTLQTQVDMENLETGIYLMRVTVNGTQKSFRVIKK